MSRVVGTKNHYDIRFSILCEMVICVGGYRTRSHVLRMGHNKPNNVSGTILHYGREASGSKPMRKKLFYLFP